ncbi:MAG: nucleotidyltransferase domain-containing protein [Candidatus Binatia bacterium]
MDNARVDDPKLAEIVRRLVEAYQPERIYLFGSKARDQANPDSDYDIMVVIPDSALAPRRRSRLAYEVLRGTEQQSMSWCGRESHLKSGFTSKPRSRLLFSAKESYFMPHDAERVSETRAWILKSARDLQAAAHDLRAVPPLLEDVVFHCQQAAEKEL